MQFHVGNRDLFGQDYRWIPRAELADCSLPPRTRWWWSAWNTAPSSAGCKAVDQDGKARPGRAPWP